jgi:fructan beta-fructosidase
LEPPDALRAALLALGLAALAAAGRVQEPAPDVLIADFEGADYGAWVVQGDAFGEAPARGTLPGQMQVSGFRGEGLVNTYLGGDGATGTLTSPSFRVERRYLNFLIGGGMHPGETCVDLLLDGEVVRTATGPNDRPGGSERLDWASWDVADLAGREVVLRIVDRATGGWGHVNVDHVHLSERKLAAAPAQRTLVVNERYLHLPVATGAPMRRVRLEVDGRTVRELDIELADGEPGFWVFADLAPFQEQALTVHVDRLPSDSRALEQIRQAARVPGADALYDEPLRPQVHFSSRRGWNNDPNGLVFLDGEWHLYYQHNPYGWAWGNMHWGHAVSRDLVRWEEQPIALYPREFGDWCFSGSAVVDRLDTAGFRRGEEEVIVAAYTSTGRGECIAYSNDRGRTFTEYEGNPVVVHRGRDPKVIWYEPRRHWVMAVYDEQERSRGIAFYISPDLKSWARTGRIHGWYECPELFELPLDGDPEDTRWIVYAADGHYAVGRFDGETFHSESGKHPGNHGNALYAAQTFNDVPASDGRRVQIGWGRIATPGMAFNQMMLFPTELTLRSTPEGPRLHAQPVRELETLHDRRQAWAARSVSEAVPLTAGFPSEMLHVRAEVELSKTPGDLQVTLELRGVPITCDLARGEVRLEGCTAPLPIEDGRLRLEALVDRTSIELFAGDGRVYMPVGVLLDPAQRTVVLTTSGAPVQLRSLEVFELRSAWR